MLKNEREYFDKIKNEYFFTIYIIAKTSKNKGLKEMFLKSIFEQYFEKIFKKDQKNNENKKFKIVNGEIIYPNTEDTDDEISLTESYKVKDKIKTVENSDNSKKENKKDKPDNSKKEKDEEEIYRKKKDIKRGRPPKIEGFYLMLRAANKSKLTIENYKSDIRQWDKWAKKKEKGIYSLGVEEVEEYISRKNAHIGRRNLSSLKQLSKWYLRQGYEGLYLEMEKVIKPKKGNRIPKAKDRETYLKILNEAKEMVEGRKREGLWLGLMLNCGLRISEIQTVELIDGCIQVRGKGDKERRIPCPKWLYEELKTFEKDGRGGYRKKRQVIDRSLRRLGYSKFHSLRHTYATTLYHKGLGLDDVKTLLGHADISTTQIYTKTKVVENVLELLKE